MGTKLTGWQRFWVMLTVVFILVAVILTLRNFELYLAVARSNDVVTVREAMVHNLVDFIELLLIPIVGWGVYWVWRGFRGGKSK